jgi:hypothetical protein
MGAERNRCGPACICRHSYNGQVSWEDNALQWPALFQRDPVSFDPEWLCEEASQLAEASMQRDPRHASWGMYAWGDAPAAIGGGMGAFQWFATRQELLDFVCDHSPSMYTCFDSEQEWQIQRQRLRLILASLDQEQQETLKALNQELRGWLQYDWIGHYDVLMTADTVFARRVRQDFRHQLCDDEFEQGAEANDSVLVLNAEDEKDWLEFLTLYGL